MGDIRLSWQFVRHLFREAFQGKTLMRICMNWALRDMIISGNVLDLGSKSNAASYNRFLQHREPYTITYTDLQESGSGVIALNLEQPFPLQTASYDAITCFNTLEHIYNHANVIRESHRVLKEGGVFIGGTPFLVNYHGDPHDYFRYTHESIEKLFAHAGFVNEQMVYLGFGPFTAASSMVWFVCPKFLRAIFGLKCILLDVLLLRIKKSQRLRYPLGYVYLFRIEHPTH